MPPARFTGNRHRNPANAVMIRDTLVKACLTKMPKYKKRGRYEGGYSPLILFASRGTGKKNVGGNHIALLQKRPRHPTELFSPHAVTRTVFSNDRHPAADARPTRGDCGNTYRPARFSLNAASPRMESDIRNCFFHRVTAYGCIPLYPPEPDDVPPYNLHE